MGINPHDTPVKLPCQTKVISLHRMPAVTYTVSCRREIPHVMSGLFGRKLQLGIRGGDLISFVSGNPSLRSYLVLRLTGEKLAISSGVMSLDRLIELNANESFTFESGAVFSRKAELGAFGAFGLSGNANLLKGRLRLISEMDDCDIAVWDGMSLSEIDFIIEGE